MKITFENGLSKPVANERELLEALTNLSAPNNTFFILEQTSGAHLQAALVDGAWWVEKREEDIDHQMRAFGAEPNGLFSKSEIKSIASCYLNETDCPSIVEWRECEPLAQVFEPWLARPQKAFDKQASMMEKLHWLEAWMNYFIARLFFIVLVAVWVGFVFVLLVLVWHDLFG